MTVFEIVIASFFGLIGTLSGALLTFWIAKKNSERNHEIALEQTKVSKKTVDLQERDTDLKVENQAFTQLERINKRLDDYAAAQDVRYSKLEADYEQLQKDYKKNIRIIRTLCKSELEKMVTQVLLLVKGDIDGEFEAKLLKLSQDSKKKIDDLELSDEN